MDDAALELILRDLRSLLSLDVVERILCSKKHADPLTVVDEALTAVAGKEAVPGSGTSDISFDSFQAALKNARIQECETNADDELARSKTDPVWKFVCALMVLSKRLTDILSGQSLMPTILSDKNEIFSANHQDADKPLNTAPAKPVFSISDEQVLQKCMQVVCILGIIPCIERELGKSVLPSYGLYLSIVSTESGSQLLDVAEQIRRMQRLFTWAHCILQSALRSVMISKSLVPVVVIVLFAQNQTTAADVGNEQPTNILMKTVFLPQLIGTLLYLQRIVPASIAWLHRQCSSLLTHCLMSGSESGSSNTGCKTNGVEAVIRGIFMCSPTDTENMLGMQQSYADNEPHLLSSLATLLQRAPRSVQSRLLYFQHVWPSLLSLLHSRRDKILHRRCAKLLQIMLSDEDNKSPLAKSVSFLYGFKMLMGPLLQIEANICPILLKADKADTGNKAELGLNYIKDIRTVIPERRMSRTIDALYLLVIENVISSTATAESFVRNVLYPVRHSLFCLYFASLSNIAVSRFRKPVEEILLFYLAHELLADAADAFADSSLRCFLWINLPVKFMLNDAGEMEVVLHAAMSEATTGRGNGDNNEDDVNMLRGTVDAVANSAVQLFSKISRRDVRQLIVLRMLYEQTNNPGLESANNCQTELQLARQMQTKICAARILELVADKIGELFSADDNPPKNNSTSSVMPVSSLTPLLEILCCLLERLADDFKNNSCTNRTLFDVDNGHQTDENDDEVAEQIEERGLLLITIMGPLLLQFASSSVSGEDEPTRDLRISSDIRPNSTKAAILPRIVAALERIETVFGQQSDLGSRSLSLRFGICVQCNFPLKENLQSRASASGDTAAPTTEIDKAWQLINDPLMPIRAGGYVRVRQLIGACDPHAHEYYDRILDKALADIAVETDSYAYLAIIECLAALAANKTSYAERTVRVLCAQFAGFEHIGSDAIGKTNSKNIAGVVGAYSEVRIVLAEALVKAVRLLGAAGVQNSRLKSILLNSTFFAVRDKDADVAASGIVALGELCSLMGYAVGDYVQEIFHLLTAELAYRASSMEKPDSQRKSARRAAAQCLCRLLECNGGNTAESIGGARLRDFYRIARRLATDESESDVVVRQHCEAACVAVDKWMHAAIVERASIVPNETGIAKGLPSPVSRPF